ncbi:hypothetical protein M5D96_012901, partial [Drosophila gunungcola]
FCSVLFSCVKFRYLFIASKCRYLVILRVCKRNDYDFCSLGVSSTLRHCLVFFLLPPDKIGKRNFMSFRNSESLESFLLLFFSDAIVCRSAAKYFCLLLLVAFEHFSLTRLC